jgi:hypothetical protein
MNIVAPQPTKSQGKKQAKWRSFTFDDQAHINASEKEAQLLIRNPNADRYWLAGRITIRLPLTPADHQRYWHQFTKQVRKSGLVMYWVREFDGDIFDPNDQAHLHYHLVILKPDKTDSKRPALLSIQNQGIRHLLKTSLPLSIRSQSEVYLEPIHSPIAYCRYILKAKTTDGDPRNYTPDKHKAKRRLFPRCGLKKIGFIGKFWAKSKSELWQEVIQEMASKAKDPTYKQQKQAKQANERAYEQQKRQDELLLSMATTQERQEAKQLARLTTEDYKTIVVNLVRSGTTEQPIAVSNPIERGQKPIPSSSA